MTKQNTPVRPSFSVLIPCSLSPWRVQHLSPAPLSHLDGHLFQSSLPVVRRLTKQNTPVCPYQFVFVRSGCLFGVSSTSWVRFLRTTFPLGWSPLPVKSPIGPSIDQTEHPCVPFSVCFCPFRMSLWRVQHFLGPLPENPFPTWLVTLNLQAI